MRQTFSCAGCRRGGGRDDYEIRTCPLGRGLSHYTECPSFGGCEHATILDHTRSGAAGVGMSVLFPGENPEAAIPQWMQQLKTR
jgi:hypothetical protein